MYPRRLGFLLFLLALNIGSPATGQDSRKPAKPDYSGEAYVIEQHTEQWTFENDGTGTREDLARVHIQSEAGLRHYGVLIFSYQKATEMVDVDYVRVRKPEGTTISTPLDDFQDMPAEVTREAPFYSDVREKHFAVKGLSVGDVLEYRCHWNQTKALAPGQFWVNYQFSHDEVVLEEKLQVNVPRDRPVKFKSPSLTPVVTEQGRYRVYTWTSSSLEHKKPRMADLADFQIHGKFPAVDVQLSSFKSWEEIGRWYDALQRDRIVASDEVRAKAAELTRTAKDDFSKTQAIYKFVRNEFRYIGVSFGIGRYQPHSAAEVLNNQYGDCKDKHTLLASLLSAAGVPAYPALISTARAVDPDVPSPAQFDHVITVLPRGKDMLWLDATMEVAPFGYLLPQLRDKEALVVVPDKPSALLTTPANLPFPTSWTFKIDAKLDDSGTLTGKVEQSLRGDLEVIWRMGLRSHSRSEWNEFIQQISYELGFAGEVTDAEASMPEATESPLHVSYNYKRKE